MFLCELDGYIPGGAGVRGKPRLTLAEFDVLFRLNYNKRHLNYFRIPMHGHNVPLNKDDIRSGQAMIIQPGEDLTIVAVGSQLKTAYAALETLREKGIEVELIYIHTIKPFDAQTVNQSLLKTHRCLVIEEHGFYGGVFDDVLRASKDLQGVQYASICIPNQFLRDYGSYEDHCRSLGFSVEGIMKKVSEEFEPGISCSLKANTKSLG